MTMNNFMEMVKALPFKTAEQQVELIKALFNHGYDGFSLNSLSGIPAEALELAINETREQLETFYRNKPSITSWLSSALFKDCPTLPLALLFIEWYDQHPSNSTTRECNFREIYHFLYELTMNQPPTPLSSNSARILYNALSDVLNEPWPNMQEELLKFFSQVYQYNRSTNRRMYPGKKTLLERKKA